MTYRKLSKENIIDYLKSIDGISNVFSSFDNIEIKEIGNGNLNFVYTITNCKNPIETAILKQAVPYLRCVGESWPLNEKRMHFEIMAFEKYKELYPKCVPDIYYADKEMALILMQNLNKHKILRDEMNRGKIFYKLAEHISSFLAHIIFYTSDWYLDSISKKNNVEKFMNKELCELTEKFIFTHPFYNSETNSYSPDLTQDDIDMIHKDNQLRVIVSNIRRRFLSNTECLLHGDFHTGSIMVNESQTYIIDPEFAFYGSAGFDLGLFIGNMLLAYVAHSYRQKLLSDSNSIVYRTWILDTIKNVWVDFAKKFDALWCKHIKKHCDPFWAFWDYDGGLEDHAELRKSEILRILKDTVGIAGCVIIRRILGIAKVSDITSIEDTKEKARVERLALKIGRLLIINHENIHEIWDALDIVTKISPISEEVIFKS